MDLQSDADAKKTGGVSADCPPSLFVDNPNQATPADPFPYPDLLDASRHLSRVYLCRSSLLDSPCEVDFFLDLASDLTIQLDRSDLYSITNFTRIRLFHPLRQRGGQVQFERQWESYKHRNDHVDQLGASNTIRFDPVLTYSTRRLPEGRMRDADSDIWRGEIGLMDVDPMK